MEHGKQLNKVTSLCASLCAFDTVDHSVLMAVLRDKCKFSDESLDWFSTHLYPRKCRVKVSSDYSKDADLSFSVPQGSVAGLQLFSLYISTLGDIVVLSGNEIHGFADDHVIKNSFTVDTNNEEMSIRALENCLVITRKWMNENRLKMNISKTEIILIGSRQKIAKCNTSSINVCGDQVERNENIKHLGVQIYETLSFRDFSTQKCKVATLNIYRIIKIRKILNIDACKTLTRGLVLVHLDYSNAILSGIPKTDIRRMQHVQNFADKVVLGKKKSDSSTECLYKLHWLPISARIEYKVLVPVYKCLNSMAPKYLSNLLTLLPNCGYVCDPTTTRQNS